MTEQLTPCTALRVRLPRPLAATSDEASKKILEWERELDKRLHEKYEDLGMFEYVETVLPNEPTSRREWGFVRHAEVLVDGGVAAVEGAVAIIQDYLAYFDMSGAIFVSWSYRDPDFRINASGGGATIVTAGSVGGIVQLSDAARKSAERLGIEILN